MLIKLTNEPDIQKGYFVLWAFRYGNPEKHSYSVGFYTSLESAKHNAKLEATERGGKYSIVIYQVKGNRLFEIYEIPSPYMEKVFK